MTGRFTVGFLSALACISLPRTLRADGAVTIGPISPIELSLAGPSGITFDGSNNPLLIDGFGHAVWRIDAGNASVVATYPLIGGEVNTRGLAFFNGRYVTTRDANLATIALDSGSISLVGAVGSYNFESLAFHPGTGQLWLLNDCADPACLSGGGAQLWSVDQFSGAATLVRDFSAAGIGQATALAIDNDGHFYVATLFGGYANLWQVDPNTGNVTFIANASLGFLSILVGLAFDPSGQRLYGIEDQRLAQPHAWNLVTIALAPSDSDGDGVPDSIDHCAATAPGSIVDATGCAIADLCPCVGSSKNHGAYQSCVVRVAEQFLDNGLITRGLRNATVSAAASSACGR